MYSGGSRTGAAAAEDRVVAAVLAIAALDFSNVHKKIPVPATAVVRLDPRVCLRESIVRESIVMLLSNVVDVILSLHNPFVLLSHKSCIAFRRELISCCDTEFDGEMNDAVLPWLNAAAVKDRPLHKKRQLTNGGTKEDFFIVMQ